MKFDVVLAQKTRFFLVGSIALLSQACSTLPSKNNTEQELEITAAKIEKKAAPSKSIEIETLFDIMVAEIAAKEKRYDITLGNYLRQAHYTQDPGVAARTTQIARYLRAHQATMDSVNLWLQLEPNNAEALQVAATEYLHANEFDKSIEYIDRLLKQNENANFEYLLQQSERIPNAKRKDLIGALSKLTVKHPQNPNVWFTKALAEEMNGDFDSALTSSSKAIDLDNSFLPGILFKAELLSRTQRPNEATKILKGAVKQFPTNKRLRLIYADSLLKSNDTDKALDQFEWLRENHPADHDTTLASALILWDNGQSETAKKYLLSINNQAEYADEINSNLAEIYKSEKNNEKTIYHLTKVSIGPFYPIAQTQLALLYSDNNQTDLALSALKKAKANYPQGAIQFYSTESEVLTRAGKTNEALKILEDALKQHPNHPQLLYSHAMVADRMNRLDILEKDLRTILKQNPDNTLALNALGYSLSEKTNRYAEALELVQKASSIEPNDPAIMDSLGWIYYKMGNLPKSLFYLKKAHDALHDHEIAAHYGELLWTSGQHEEARKVWQAAYKRFPKSEPLMKTMKRFLVEPLKP